MKHALALLPPVLLVACSHPLEIVGDGDIVSPGRAIYCTLEQQPCPNIVAGNYIRTYVGLPRPGWDFERWENCGTQHPNCSFNVPAAVVSQYWFQTMPPLRAIFLAVPAQALTDTGITFGGYWPSSNDTGCAGTNIAQQDCSHGRDATDNNNVDGHAGFSYTKLASDGTELPAAAGSWACVRDNVTGRVWEVKTDDGGLHDKDTTYRWGGNTVQGSGYGTYYADWNVLIDGSNNAVLCGFSDWRAPTQAELLTLVNFNRTNPAIDTAYFPYTAATFYWSATPSIWGATFAWNVDFLYGNSNGVYQRTNAYALRLVRTDE